MTRINWDEVHELTRLDEIIAFSIVTLQEAYTAPNNHDLDVDTKADVRDWVRWEIAYDEQGRAFFRYAASLYVVDRHPLGDRDFLELINAPTKWLVNHSSLGVEARAGDTSLKINTLVDIPPQVTSLEKLLFWAIVLGDWWNLTLKYLANTDNPVMPVRTPIGHWGGVDISPGADYDTESTPRWVGGAGLIMNATEPPKFYTVYLKKPSQSSPSSPHFTVIGAYADIRDAVQAMVTAYRLKPSSQFGLESSQNKPLHWVHRSRYQDEHLT
jgi:hypothetical protein